MQNIKMTMFRMQLNSKFVNNMFPEWGRFVTVVKLNIGLRDSNYDQLYGYLKQHEAHANENKMMLDRFTKHTVDLLALMSNVSNQHHYPQSSITPPSTYVQPHSADTTQLDSGLSLTDNLIKNLTNKLALLTQSYKTYLPQTNNQLRTSSNLRNQPQFKTAGLSFRMFRVDRIKDRGTMHGVQVQLVIGELKIELGMLIQVKQGRLSATTATVDRMPPKRSSKSKASTMSQAAIRKLVADSIAAALETQTTTMEEANNSIREIPVVKRGNYKEFISC
nr:hypothetical protein [Tanacetum cinerariifolium]